MKRYYRGLSEEEVWNPPSYTKIATNYLLDGVLTRRGVKDWWLTAQPPELDGRTPNRAWADGDKKLVYEIAASYLDPNYS